MWYFSVQLARTARVPRLSVPRDVPSRKVPPMSVRRAGRRPASRLHCMRTKRPPRKVALSAERPGTWHLASRTVREFVRWKCRQRAKSCKVDGFFHYARGATPAHFSCSARTRRDADATQPDEPSSSARMAVARRAIAPHAANAGRLVALAAGRQWRGRKSSSGFFGTRARCWPRPRQQRDLLRLRVGRHLRHAHRCGPSLHVDGAQGRRGVHRATHERGISARG